MGRASDKAYEGVELTYETELELPGLGLVVVQGPVTIGRSGDELIVHEWYVETAFVRTGEDDVDDIVGELKDRLTEQHNEMIDEWLGGNSHIFSKDVPTAEDYAMEYADRLYDEMRDREMGL